MNWNRPKQTILANRTDPTAPPGDCWRCCIAAVLQVPAETVPHFVAHNGGLHYESDTQSWLATRGYTLVRSKPGLQFPRMFNRPYRPLPVIASGPTRRSQRMGQLHAVVYYDGEMVYDPHPDDCGLTAITEESLLVPTAHFDLVAEVRGLMALMRQLDPNGGATRHPDWPLQLRGDADAALEVCERFARLEQMTSPEIQGDCERPDANN